MPDGPLQVGVLAYEGCLGTEVFGIVDVLLIADRIARATGAGNGPLFDTKVMSATGRAVKAAGGVSVGAARFAASLDVLVVPGFELAAPAEVGRRLQQWPYELRLIARAANHSARIGSVCVGAFLVGEAGLLSGRQVTTSWLFADALASRYPTAIVQSDAMLVCDGPIITTAAFNAVHDLALRLVRDHAGDDLARRTARVTLVADNRNSQAPYVDADLLGTSSEAAFIVAARAWLAERMDRPYALRDLAAAFHVSTRTMLRRFREQSGESPLAFLQAVRINAAKRLLEDPDANVATVMRQVGYSDAAAFRRLFAGRVGMSPASYRHQFTHAVDAPAR